MKKALVVFLAMAMLAGALSGCGAGAGQTADAAGTPAVSGAKDGSKLKVALMINGTLGDLALFDSANDGLSAAIEKYGIQGKVFEAGYDVSKWESTLYDICDSGYDLVITGTYNMVDVTTKVAAEYPDTDFIHFDAQLDYTDGALPNVYSMDYTYNQGSFLAGYVAASLSKTGNIGGIGAMSIPAVNDYLIGYIAGARYKNPDIKLQIKYTNNFTDSAAGMELATQMYNAGADIIANGAAVSGLGIMDAAKTAGKYVIGSDSDQAMLYQKSDPQKAATIVTSVMKRIDLSLVRAIGMYIDGTLPLGSGESLGMAQDCIQLADNQYYEKYVPESVRAEVTALQKKILSGEIKVPSAYGMSDKDIADYLNAGA
jgi:basic membrane protein A